MENEKTFTVEGIGTFHFVIEVPHKQFFFDTRKRMADLLGVRNLIALEQMREEAMKPDADETEKIMGIRANAEISRAGNYFTMKDHITKYPDGVSLEALSPADFEKVESEFVKALKFFRTPPAPATGTDTPSSKS